MNKPANNYGQPGWEGGEVKYTKCEHPTRKIILGPKFYKDPNDFESACSNCFAYNLGSGWTGALPPEFWICNQPKK